MSETAKTKKTESGNKKRVRSSTSGRYTNKDSALANPADTVSETPKRRADIKSAVEGFTRDILTEDLEVLTLSRTDLSKLLAAFAKFYSKRKK